MLCVRCAPVLPIFSFLFKVGMSFSSASSSEEEASEADDQLEDASVTSQRSQRYHLRTLSSPYRSAAGATAVAGHRRSAAPRQPAAAAGQATAPRPTTTAVTQAAASARLASLRRIAADAIPVSAQARRLRESQDRNIGGDPSSRGGGGGGGIEAAAASATDSGPHCTICFDSLNDNSSPVRALLCGHVFHRACILKAWSFVRPTLPKCCPVCRQICFAAAEVDNTPDVQILDSAR